MTAFEFQPIKFQLNDEQCEALDFTEFQSLVFNTGGATLSAPPGEPRRFLLLEFSGPDAPAALEMLGEDHAGFAWSTDDHYRAVVMLSQDASPDECLTLSKAVQKAIGRYLEVTFNETTLLPAPTKDTAIRPLDGKPIAVSGILHSVSAYDLKNIDRRALAVFVSKLKDHDLWTLQRGDFPLGAVQTERGHDEALARILHRHGAKPEWIAEMVSANNRYGLEARHSDIQYLNEVVRDTCTANEVDAVKFDAPYMADLWDEDPATRWLIQDVIEDGVIAEVWGESGSLKTFIAVDMAVAVASGKHYHGEEVRRTGPVLIIPGEGRQGLKKRIRVLCQKRGLGSDIKIRIANRPVMLAKADQADWLRSQIADFDSPPVLIILDTLARNFGGNENSTEDMNAFLDNTVMISRAFGVPITILIIHHCGHDTTHSRGAYAFHAGIDNEYQAVVDAKTGTIKLINIKMKDTDLRETFYFQRQVIQLLDKDGNVMMDNGKPVDSLVLVVGDVQREAERDAFFKDHPEFKTGKRAERLCGVLRYARHNPEATDNSARMAVAPEVKDTGWIKEMRSLMFGAGLIEGDRFKLTKAGLEALRVFDAFTDLSMGGKAPTLQLVKGGVRDDLL
jgi:hypothetical protein